MRILCIAKDSHILSTKNNSVFVIFMFGNFSRSLTNDVVNFEQLGPVVFHLLSQSTLFQANTFSVHSIHQENMSVKCVPPKTQLLYCKTGVCMVYPFFLFFAEAVLTSTHNLCFGAKIRTTGPMVL